jgi:hypothetical protein
MPGFLTSYAGLFLPTETNAPGVTSIEIPLIQRDYAQGRTDARTSDIRERFLDVLHEALTEGRDVGLDFIYGDVEDGTLRPLDGQQRLTTLFLLHWYLGYRAAQLSERQAWMSFSYATRPTARLFCEQLVTAHPPPDESAPAAWIVDQPWYLYVWRNDPTIQAMLVMIDAIHSRFADCDPRSAWQRLIASDAPAISFQLLPIDDMGSGEDLYIKMNSRGKPLTPFENFKARFERAIAWAGDKATEFDHRIDGSWSDILWRLRGYDDIVDDKFMRYFEFITDICQWRAGQLPGGVRLETRALQLFGTAGRQAEESLEFLFDAFDTWAGADIGDEFGQLFATNRADLARNPDRLLLFGTETGADLFDACCRHYGTQRFTYGRTLLLFAVLLDRVSPSEDLPRRLRVLRNLIEASESELRPHRLPALVADVQRIVADGLTRRNQRLQQSAGRRRAGEMGLPEGASRFGDSSVPARGPPFAPRLPAGVRPGRRHFRPPGSGLRITDGRAGRLARPHRRTARRRQLRAAPQRPRSAVRLPVERRTVAEPPHGDLSREPAANRRRPRQGARRRRYRNGTARVLAADAGRVRPLQRGDRGVRLALLPSAV